MSNYVGPLGRKDSKIVLVGEAPGEQEDKECRPFVGPSGRLLDGILRETGIDRQECYITNVLKHRPLNNDLGTVPPAEIVRAREMLRGELNGCEANVIVPLGEFALQAVTGKMGIGNLRGSILSSNVWGRLRKVIPTYHPAYIMRKWVPNRAATGFDFRRIKEQSRFPEVRLIPRVHGWPRNARDIKGVRELLLEDVNKPLSVDIETNQDTHTLLTIGFSVDKSLGFSIPLGKSWYDCPESWTAAKELITDLLKGPQKKVTQNGNFDITFLRTKGYEFNNWWLDTMYMHHLLYVELPRSLAFLTSIYTDMPFYKDMVDHAVDERRMSMDVLVRYNALDAMVTLEIAEKLLAHLRANKLEEFYQEHYTRLIEPLMEAQLEGVRVDVGNKERLREELKEELKRVVEEATPLLPKDWMSPKDKKRKLTILNKIKKYESEGKHLTQQGYLSKPFKNWVEKLDNFVPYGVNFSSPQQMESLLYGYLKIPVHKKDGKVTTDDEALQKIIRGSRTTALQGKLCELILEHRGLVKLIGTYLDCPIDEDGRIRCTYNMASTKTGRLSSEGNIFGTGTNLQNIPKRKGLGGKLRALFLPDEGDIFIAADYGQAEARVVGYSAEEMGFIECFEKNIDLFRFIASKVYRTEMEYATKEQRDVTKVLVHATDYGMEVELFAFTAKIPLEEAKVFWERYRKDFPRLPLWREEIRNKVDRDRVLRTCLGRFRVFYDRVKSLTKNTDGTVSCRYNGSLLRDAFSYEPQSTVADLLNLALVRTWDLVHKTEWYVHRPKFRLQVHDEMVWSVHPADSKKMLGVLQEAMRIPLMLHGREFIIPSEIVMGEAWSKLD